MTTTTQQAIDRSISHDEIVHMPYTDETQEYLTAESDGSVETGAVVEFWGVDEDGQGWRVHLDR